MSSGHVPGSDMAAGGQTDQGSQQCKILIEVVRVEG